MKGQKYEKLRQEHPQHISLDKLHRICKIAKRSARYLVQHGIIPAEDTGKKTWRYKIDIEGVIAYLRHREKAGSMIPPGAASSRGKNRANNRKSFARMVCPGQEQKIAEYFGHIYADCAEVLTAEDVSGMTGLNKSTVWKLLQGGYIKSLESSPKYLIARQHFMEFVTTRRFLESRSNSETFKKILGGYEIWRAK